MANLESGPTAARVAQNIERVRKARQLKQKDVSDRLGEAGRPMLATVISKVERGERRIDVDDLIALAVVLNVSPLALLLPPEGGSGTAVIELTTEVHALLADAWRWAAGTRALPPELGDTPDQKQQEEYEQLSQSARLRHIRRQPAGQAVDSLRDDVHRLLELAQITSDTTGVDEEFRRRLTLARETLARLGNELDRVDVDHAELEGQHQMLRAKRQQEAAEKE